MPNYSLVIDSKFQPFSFERYIQPYQMYGKAYREQEDALAEIADKADEIAGKINPLTENETYQKYKSYADALKAQSDELAIKGLNPASRRAMLSLRSRYGKEVAPINAAWERRRELAKEQRALRGTDSSIRFDNDYSTMSLDTLMSNPEMSYSSISGNKDVAAVTADMAEQVARSILSDPTYKSVLNSQYFQQRQQAGVPLEEILKEIASASGQEVKGEINQALRTIRNTVKSQLSSNPAYDESWADSYINRGLYHAIGTAKYDLVKNGEYIDAATRRQLAQGDRRIALAEREFNANYEPDGKGGYRRKPTPARIPTKKEMIPIQGGGFYDPNTGTIRNEKEEIVLNPKGGVKPGGTGGTDAPTTREEKLLALGASPIYGYRNLFGSQIHMTKPGDTGGFSWNSSFGGKKVSFASLSRQGQADIRQAVERRGLLVSDVDIYRDSDWWNDDHYAIVPKGWTPEGGVNQEQLNFSE